MGRVFLMVGTRFENKVVRVARALRVSVFAGGSNGEDDVWWRAWVRSFAAATMMSVAEEVGIWMLCGIQLTVSEIRTELVLGIHAR